MPGYAEQQVLQPRPVSAHCQPCRKTTRFRFSTYATGGEEAAPGKPRAFHRTCTTCTHTVLTLADLHDSYSLCVLTAMRRVPIEQKGKVEQDDAVAYLFWHLWRLYLAWRPDAAVTSAKRVSPSFLGYASHWLPRRLDAYIGEATGEVSSRRVHPRADSLTNSLSEYEEGAATTQGGTAQGMGHHTRITVVPSALQVAAADADDLGDTELVVALGGDAQDAADDRQGDLRWLLGVGDSEGARSAAI